MTIELPRHVIDSKGASNADTKYLVKIDGKGVDYANARTLSTSPVLATLFSISMYGL